MRSCRMDPKSIKLELVTLIVFTLLLVATSLMPVTRGLDFLGLPLAIIAAAFGIPAAKLPHLRAYAITASVFAVLSALCFIISTCLTLYSLSILSINVEYMSDNQTQTVLNVIVAITIAILVFCTATTCALSVKAVQTATYHKINSQNLEAVISRTPIVVLSPSENSYLKMPPPLPIGEEYPSIDKDELPPPYATQDVRQ